MPYMEAGQPLCRATRGVGRVLRALRGRLKTIRRIPVHVRVDIRWRLGDEIMALPIYEALSRRYPNSRISVLCNYADLLEGNPFASPAGPNDAPPDFLIDLRGGPRQVYRIAHYARLARVPVPDSRPRLYFQDWHSPLLNEIPQPFIAIAPGASWPTKRWPPDRWRAVADALQNLGHTVVELGHESERVGLGLSLSGRTSVRDAACVLHAARLLVAADSGLMHLALAAGTPVLALFGPTDPDILIQNEPLLHVIRSGIECQACWNQRKEEFKLGSCPEFNTTGDAPCMEAIATSEVIAKATSLLSSV